MIASVYCEENLAMESAERIRIRLAKIGLQLSEQPSSPEELSEELLELFGPEYRPDMEQLLKFCRQDPQVLCQALLKADRELRSDHAEAGSSGR